MRARDVWSLAKPRIAAMVGVATVLGFWIAAGGIGAWTVWLQAALAATLASAGTAALNQVLERRADARMDRTGRRPLPAGRLSPRAGVVLGAVWVAGGVAWMAWAANGLAAALTAASAVTYLGCYTPLKPRSYWCVLVGALPGALPPLIGWAAATGRLDATAGAVFAWIVAWQVPHVAALAEIYRADYARVGWCMDPLGPIRGRALVAGLGVSVALMIALSLLPAWWGTAGPVYGAVALVLGAVFGATVWRFARRPARRAARISFVASIVYLPLVLGALAFDVLSA